MSELLVTACSSAVTYGMAVPLACVEPLAAHTTPHVHEAATSIIADTLLRLPLSQAPAKMLVVCADQHH